MTDWNTRGYTDGYFSRPFAAAEAYRQSALAAITYVEGYAAGEKDRNRNPALAEERKAFADRKGMQP